MDFHSMKRKELQGLCKKHKVPANLSNLEMAKRLAEFFKEKENSLIQGLINWQDENANETESSDVVMNRKVKKVRFSPEHELIEFTRSREIKVRTWRNSVSIRTSSSSVENVDSGEMNRENVNRQGRVAWSRGLKLTKEQVNEKKRGRKDVKCHEQIKNVSTIENLDNGELREGNLDGTSRVLRSRGEKLVEDVKNTRKKGKAIVDDEIDAKALGDVDDEKSIKEIVDSPGRLTRSRWQKSTEASVTKTKRVRRVVEIVDNNVPLVSAETDDNRVVTRRSSRNRERGLGERNNGKVWKEVLAKNENAEVYRMIEPQILLTKSKRNAISVGDSRISNDDTRNHEKGGIKGSRKSAKLLAADGLGVDAESRISKGETDGRVFQIEEPINPEVRRSNRRKEVIASHEKVKNGELKAEMENTCQLSSVPQLVIAGGVSKNGKKVAQPIMRRSRRKTTILEPVASDEKIDTVAVENCETEKVLSTRRSRRVASVYKSMEIIDELGGDSIIHQKNEGRKRKRVPISKRGVVKTNNDLSSLKLSVEESRNEKGVSIAEAQLSVSEGDPGLSSDTRNKNILSDVGPTSSIKTHREKLDVSIADGAESDDTKKFTNRNELANSQENAELKTDSADFEKQISASSIEDAGKVDSLEFDVQDIIEQNITDMDKNQFEAQLFNQIKDSNRINTVDNQILQEGLNVSGNEGFAETSSSAESILLADLKVTEAEADTHTQPSSDVGDHVVEVERIFVQENLDTVETGQANVISLSIACHHNDVEHMETSKNIFDDNKEDRASKAAEVGASDSCDRCIDSTDSKSASQLMEPPSGKLRSIEGDNADEGDETYFQKGIVSELAEVEKSGSLLKDHKIASNEDDEFSVADLFDGERSFRITPQDRGIISGEYSAMISGEQGMDKESMAEIIDICLERDLEAEHTGKGEESCIDKSINLEIAKTDEGGSPVCHKSKCHDDWEFVTSNILDVERRDKIMPHDREILFGENSVEDFDEKGMEIKLRSGHEADQIAEGDEAENNEGGCLKNHKNTKDEDWEFGVSNLFDSEKSVRNTPQDRGIFFAEDSIKDFNEQVAFDDFPAVSTMCNEVKISAGSSSLPEISLSEPNSSSKSQDTGAILSDVCEFIDKEASGATIPEKEVATVQDNIQGDEMFVNKNISDGGHKIFNQADEHTTEYTPKQAEQPKSPSAITGLAMCMSQTNGKGITSPVVEGSNANEDDNDGNCGNDKDEFAYACITNVDISMDCTISKLGAESVCELEFHHTEDTEYQPKNLDEKHAVSDVGEKLNDVESSQRWTETELSNIFETTMHDVTPTGLNDTTSQGTEIANPILCINKSDANCGNSLTNKKEKEMEGERGSESAKTTYKTVFVPTNYKEVSDSNSGSGVDSEDNQFKLLFATPTKIDSPFRFELDRTSSHEKKLDRADDEVENSLCLRSSSYDSEEINYEESNEVESVELLNTSNIVLSEVSKEHLTDNTCECVKKTEENMEENIISLGESCLYEEARDKVSELTEKNTNSSSGSLRNLDKLEGCQDMLVDTDSSEKLSCGNKVCLKSERKVARSSEAAFELSDADIQKSNVLESSYHLTVCYEDSNLNETLIETFKGPMDAKVANIGSFNGTSPSLFSKASNDGDKVTERKGETGDDDDDDPYETMMSDEPHCNTEEEILKSPSVGNNTVELQSRYKEKGAIAQNVNNVLSAAEQGFSVCVAEFDVFSTLTVQQLLPRDNENGDSEKSEGGTPVYNSEGDHDEKNNKEIEENSTATKVQFSISEVIDSNNDVRSVSHEVTDSENGDIEKSNVGTPLLNLEGDHEKNDREVEENSTATIVEFPISEPHSEEKFIDSNKDVPAFGCNQFLEESDVADTIKEYIDSELARINETTALCYTADRSSAETIGEEQIKEVVFKESPTGPKTVHSPACVVDLVGNSEGRD